MKTRSQSLKELDKEVRRSVSVCVGDTAHAGGSRVMSGTSSHSEATIIARKLAARAKHARHVAEIERQEAQLERQEAQRIAEMERQASELELQAELAEIDAGSSRRSGNSSKFVTSWLEDNFESISVQVSSAVHCEHPQTTVTRGLAPLAPAPPCVVTARPPASIPSGVYTDAGLVGVTLRQPLSPPPVDCRAETHNTIHAHTLGTHYAQGCNSTNEINNTQATHAISHLAEVIANLAAAKKTSKVSDLKIPIFEGRPTDWLAFRRIYEITKSLYSPMENIVRLNISVRGAAREAISTLLVSAADPEEIMSALETRFARPEYIVLHEIAALRSLPKLCTIEVGRDLNTFACRVRNCVETMRLLNQVEYLASPELSNSIIGKLTPLLRCRWADFASTNQNSGYRLELLATFLAREADLHIKYGFISESVIRDYNVGVNVKGKNIEKIHLSSDMDCHSLNEGQQPKEVCIFCKSNSHSINKCKEFLSLSIHDRWQWIKLNKVCYKCLYKGLHVYKNCKKVCKIKGCKNKFRHHTLLHQSREFIATRNEVSPQSCSFDPEKEPLILTHSIEASQKCALRPLLKVVPVTLEGPLGKVDTYALLDDGSTGSLIDADVAKAIGASGRKSTIQLNCVSGLTKNTNVSYVDLFIKGRHSTNTYHLKNVKAIPKLGLCGQSVKPTELKNLNYLSDLVDVLSCEDAKPTILIGVDNWHLTISHSTRSSSRSQPVAVQTLLGWVLYGYTSSKTKSVEFVNHTINSPVRDDNSLDVLLKDYYRIDSIGITKKNYCTENEKRALGILDSTTHRLPSGRFETGLLWRSDIVNVPNSYNLALSRFHSLERKMTKDSVYAEAYRQKINEMFDKGYAEPCPTTRISNSIVWYLPHFGVFNPHKPGKLRVVHDAAAKSHGMCFNSLLLSGPDLLQPLLAILMRFREGRVALNADIREMFPQVKIREEDRDGQRFLWRAYADQPIGEYRMSSLMFGATSSPCTALYVKNKNAMDYISKFPKAVEAIISNHYMDDYLGSHDSVQEASQIAADIVKVHSAGGFEIRSWVSNSKEALSLISPELCTSTSLDVNINPAVSRVRILGLSWNVQDDKLIYLSDLPKKLPTPLTKRKTLSQLMRIYDPLGLITPIIIQGRIIFQDTWRTGIEWDAELPENFVSRWETWFENVLKISHCSIPRCYNFPDNQGAVLERQLHVFADASENAYACVAFWRLVFSGGIIKLSLIGGKARLAPLKPVSIPRLELQAALIAARFANYISDAHKNKASKIFYWTDSMTVLKWIKSDGRTFKPFVANRVGEILETTQISNWRYVPSALNIADDATRLQTQFDSNSRWFTGPPFLLASFEDWPCEPSLEVVPIYEEQKNGSYVGAIYNKPPELLSPVVADHSRFSEWLRLLRATARAHAVAKHFRQIVKSKRPVSFSSSSPHHYLPLTAEDINAAEFHLLFQSQLDSFSQEIACTINSKPVSKQSRLKNVTIIFNIGNLLRLSGRIGAVKDVPQEINPIVLDGRHPIVRLLIQYYHKKAAHGNNELVVNEIRQEFYVIGLRSVVKNVSRSCLFCRLRKAIPAVPPFGDLPCARLAHNVRPFSHVGLDYFGPIKVSIGRRSEKRYVALFTCMTIRAIHLEIVASLSTDSAIMAMRRFIARRGCPICIYSDNGTAFVGANNKLTELYDFAANHKITWKFIAPAAPFMGGCWERMVRSVKTALYVTLRERSPREEILSTLLMEVEAIVNSRPLTHVSVDPVDEESITPFHFLLGSSSNEPPLHEREDADLSRRVEWKKGLRLADHFWKRWIKEYLPTLIPRPNSDSSYQNFKIGDLVLIVDDSLPRSTWPRGRVIQTWPGKDGVTRVVTVATKGGDLKRPTRKLVRLGSL